ncbi:predicted protein [Nematostella vectensis]|uniref:G-protein coupled receptors family 1 profile domain-containing protein n=1 Tax=Nematostella vectensis TaxID=45351 RepID=A7RQT5_NEMVE|nr:tyramine/octopamine receptor [Nematostella vectensis]EDO46162.1 predicted protein [Nematostella vectensis]|eukprot:XP_001638225.1 predicted protein [Nematostella vectensis]
MSSATADNFTTQLQANQNGSFYFGDKPIFFEPVYDSCLIILAVLIIAINVLITVLFVRKRALRTKTNTLLVSLAISDLNLGFIGIPTSVACNAFVYYPSTQGLCITSAVIYRFIAVSTIFHIFAITIERYILVIYPFKYMSMVRMARLRRVIAAIWTGSFFIAIIQLAWQDFTNFNSADPIKVTCALVYNIFGIAICFVIPLCVMAFTYYRMFMVIRRQINQIKKQSLASESTGETHKAPLATEMRAITIFALMLGIFATCWSTWYLGLISEYIIHPDEEDYETYDRWFSVFDFLRFSVSFINPLLYTFMKLDFREALRSLIPIGKHSNNRRQRREIYMSLGAIRSKKEKTQFLSPPSDRTIDTNSGA